MHELARPAEALHTHRDLRLQPEAQDHLVHAAGAREALLAPAPRRMTVIIRQHALHEGFQLVRRQDAARPDLPTACRQF